METTDRTNGDVAADGHAYNRVSQNGSAMPPTTRSKHASCEPVKRFHHRKAVVPEKWLDKARRYLFYFIYLPRVSWTEKRTNKSILNELQTRRELLAQIIKRKMAFFGHACRNNKCNLVKTCILGMMSGKRRRGRPRMQYIDNIKKWTRASLEENVRRTEDRSAWRERSCAAGAANVRTDDAD